MIDNNACPVCNDLIDVYQGTNTEFSRYNFSGIFNIAHLTGSGVFPIRFRNYTKNRITIF